MTRIAIIGAGIGGLSAAVSLRVAGFDVNIYEQAPELTEVGGGINMGPNACRVLFRLGFGPALDRVGVRPLTAHQRRWDDGGTLQKAPLNPLCEQLYGAPHMTLHRRDLLDVIASGMAAERVHLGHRLAGFTDQGDHVEAWFENGARIATDVLVGADGIHSTVRAALFGEEAPVFAGCVAYRGLVPAERIADLGLELGSQSWLGPGGHFVHYFVSSARLLNFVGWTEHDVWNREDWTDRATTARARAAFAGWHPQIDRIISAAETVFIWALFDRDPQPTWSVGRVTLLGDACHPMYPFMGQGAAQAIEDGAALAAWLRAGDDVPEALLRYEHARQPRVSRLQAMSRANKTRFHMQDGPEQRARDAEWARAGDREPDAPRWLYGYDPAVLEQGSVIMPDAELHILAGGGIADPLDEIAAGFVRAHGVTIVPRYGTLPQLIDLARRGVPFDLAVVPRDVLDDAAVRALIVPDSIRTVARAAIGVAVRLGQKMPDISTPEALKRTLLAARAVASIPASATGIRIAEIYAELGIVAEMAARTRAQPGPKQIAEAVTSGEAELGLFLVNVLIDPRLAIVGPVPAELQREVVYDVAVAANASEVEVARAFVAYVLSAEAAEVIRGKGMQAG